MGEVVAQWNLLQLSFIAVYPAYLSYIRIVDGMSLVALYVFLFVLCIPAMLIQMKLGGYTQKGIVALLSHHLPIAKGVGIALLIDLFLTCVYVGPLVCHFGMYSVISMLEHPYVWEKCDNSWNSKHCVDLHSKVSANVINGQRKLEAEKEFFYKGYLQLSPAIGNISGFPTWTFTEQLSDLGLPIMPVSLTAVWLLVFLFTCFGPRVAGWILFLLGPGFVGTLFAVLGYGYKNLKMEHTNEFLMKFYNLDFKGFVNFSSTHSFVKNWNDGFMLLMNSFPVWTAIAVSMGKFAGKGKISRNTGWLIAIVMYAMVVQIPQLAMAPYMGNLLAAVDKSLLKDSLNESGNHFSLHLVFTAMPAAFTELKVPPIYAMLFFLSLFISGFMLLCVSMLTIVDNIVESMTTTCVRLHNKKNLCTFIMTFVMMTLLLGLGVLQTTKAGMYYTYLMDQSVLRLRFITVFILAISVIIVYVKHSFALWERIIISVWCIFAATAAAGFWVYSFILSAGKNLAFANHSYPQTWDLISWIISGIPYIAIPAAAMHSCASHEGSCRERMKYMMCGSEEEGHNYDGYYPATEPTAPPAYSYMDSGHTGYGDSLYPMDELNKHYDPEMEPLDTRLRSSRI